MMQLNNVMIDLETLATTADAVIMSLGAVRFSLETNEIDTENAFYVSLSIEDNLQLGRRIDESTLIWWMQQSVQAQGVFHEAKHSLHTALPDFAEWFAPTADALVWSNGADFDLPMLAHIMRQIGVEVPWHYANSRCVRTYRNLPGARNVKVNKVGTHHNALDDAVYQASLVQAIHHKLFTGHGVEA